MDTDGGPARAAARALDASDPLAGFADRFLPTAPDIVAYLDGNSLGRPLAAIGAMWSTFSDQWSARLIRGWTEGWMELPEQVGDELGVACLGAAPGQTVIADSTTVNLYKTMRAAINLRPGRRRIVLDRDNFPTNRYVAESLAGDLGLELVWLTASGLGVSVDDVLGVLDLDTAFITVSHVAYRSGYLADALSITRAAHDVGALVVWDLCHSVGCCDIRLDDWEVDFAVGCTYKFIGAGPGAPAFLYVNAAHLPGADQPIWGWLGRAEPFEMQQGYVPSEGVRSMLSGTPPVPGMLAVREGVAVIAEAGIGAIRAKSTALTELAIALTDAWLAPLGFGLATPRDPARRGSHVSISRADARELCPRLIDAGVIPDFRNPNVLRLGLSPLTTSFGQVWDAMAVLREMAG